MGWGERTFKSGIYTIMITCVHSPWEARIFPEVRRKLGLKLHCWVQMTRRVSRNDKYLPIIRYPFLDSIPINQSCWLRKSSMNPSSSRSTHLNIKSLLFRTGCWPSPLHAQKKFNGQCWRASGKSRWVLGWHQTPWRLWTSPDLFLNLCYRTWEPYAHTIYPQPQSENTPQVLEYIPQTRWLPGLYLISHFPK